MLFWIASKLVQQVHQIPWVFSTFYVYIRRKNVIWFVHACTLRSHKLQATQHTCQISSQYLRHRRNALFSRGQASVNRHIYICVCARSVNIIMCCSLYRRTIMYRHINAWLITLHRVARYWNSRNNREFIVFFNNFFKLFLNLFFFLMLCFFYLTYEHVSFEIIIIWNSLPTGREWISFLHVNELHVLS